MNHTVYLVFAITTHAVVGYTLVRTLTAAPPMVGLLAGIAPDIDLYFFHFWTFPLIHRGLLHTPFFLCVVLACLLLVGVSREWVAAVGVAFGSHLVIDSFTRTGILWLYPLSTRHFAYDIDIHSLTGNLVFWTLSAVVLRFGGRDMLRRVG